MPDYRLEELQVYEIDSYGSFDVICPDCDAALFFAAEKPMPGESGFHSNLTLGDVVKAVVSHKCDTGAYADA